MYVAKPQTSGSKKAGPFRKEDFQYQAEADQYRCPAGEALTNHFTSVEASKAMGVYWCTSCGSCRLKAQCITGKERRGRRWEHEAVLETVARRLAQNRGMMGLRRQTVERPFGTLKFWMGAIHLITTRLTGVRTGISLYVLAYNFKRVKNIVGIGALVDVLSA